MKKLFLVLLLIGCASQNATLNAVNTVKQQLQTSEVFLNDIESSLTPECKTAVIMEKINAERGNIKLAITNADNINSVCTAEKNALTAESRRWRTSTIALLMILGLLLFFKLK